MKAYRPGVGQKLIDLDRCRAEVGEDPDARQCRRLGAQIWVSPGGVAYSVCHHHHPDASAELTRISNERFRLKQSVSRDERWGWRHPEDNPVDGDVCLLAMVDEGMFLVTWNRLGWWQITDDEGTVLLNIHPASVVGWMLQPDRPSWEATDA